MATHDPGGPPSMMKRQISGGSVSEAELRSVPGVGWAGPRAGAESPFAQGLRRLRRNKTALVGAGRPRSDGVGALMSTISKWLTISARAP